MKSGTHLSLRRIIALGIDYFTIAAYGGVLFYFNFKLNNVFQHFEWFSHPVWSQVIGFMALTLPVFLYFVLFERSSRQATPGKRLLNLKVVSSEYGKAPIYCLVIRNGIKFLPWEIAHGAVHWTNYYAKQGFEVPVFLFLINAAALILAFVFVVLIFVKKDNRTLYETWSGTRVIKDE